MSGFKILDIELHHFLGFIKPRIETIKVTFVEMLQILNSTNGSGKTEFLKETSPFPINKDIFAKTGYKIIRIEKEGLVYVLTSNHKKNSFIIESTGEELNRGGTISTQEELIKLHLGITRSVWNMITGRSKFTQLDKNARRQWMEIISGLDFDYAFTVYKEIKTAISHHKGSVKVTSDTLVSESAKQLDESTLQLLKKEQEELSGLITNVLKGSQSIEPGSIHNLQNNVRKYHDEFKQALQSLFSLKSRKRRVCSPVAKPITVAEIKHELQKLKELISIDNRSIDDLTLELSELNKLKEKLVRTDGYTLTSIEVKLEKINSDLQLLTRKINDGGLVSLVTDWSLLDMDNALEYILNLQSVLHEKLEEYPTNIITLPQTKAEYDLNKKALIKLRERIIKGNSVVNKCELALKHFLECENTKCPKCEHSFKVGQEHLNEELLRKRLVDSETLLSELLQEEKLLGKQVSEYENILYFLTSVKELVLSLDNPFFNYFKELNFEILDKSSLLATVEHILLNGEFLTGYLTAVKNKSQLEVIHRELKTQDALVNLDQLTSKHQTLLDKLEQHRLVKRNRECEGKELKNYGVYLTTLLQQQSNVIAIGEKLQQERKRLVELLSDSVEKDIIREAQQRVAVVTKTISEQHALDATLTAMKKQISTSKDKLKQLMALEKALNPSVGVIARQMGGYTQAFTKQLSEVVGRLWGYELEILPPTIDGAKGMDYKFPFIIEGNVDNPIPDISEGSTATVSGFNLGIMLATRVALGMEQMPLFLDEVSHGFDTTHNERLGDFLKELLNDYQCSNMFFVHHEVDIRSVLGQHDMVVFDPSQVIITGEYNTNVEIKYLH